LNLITGFQRRYMSDSPYANNLLLRLVRMKKDWNRVFSYDYYVLS